MTWRDLVGVVLLFLGVAAVIGGIAAIARDIPLGWASLVAGLAGNYSSYRLLRPPPKVATEKEA